MTWKSFILRNKISIFIQCNRHSASNSALKVWNHLWHLCLPCLHIKSITESCFINFLAFFPQFELRTLISLSQSFFMIWSASSSWKLFSSTYNNIAQATFMDTISKLSDTFKDFHIQAQAHFSTPVVSCLLIRFLCSSQTYLLSSSYKHSIPLIFSFPIPLHLPKINP